MFTLTHRPRAQAMVEFALVLPILMLLVVGIIEVGRAVFMYSSVINASREASRYGSAYGRNNAGFPRYQDCLGIRAEAKRVGVMAAIEDDNIIIEYDHGPGTAVFDTCTGDADAAVDLHTNDRIIVTVTADYTPMTPLVPLSSRQIESSSSRTIMGIIIIHPE
jgi:Flp pilus assembly protein TadG